MCSCIVQGWSPHTATEILIHELGHTPLVVFCGEYETDIRRQMVSRFETRARNVSRVDGRMEEMQPWLDSTADTCHRVQEPTCILRGSTASPKKCRMRETGRSEFCLCVARAKASMLEWAHYACSRGASRHGRTPRRASLSMDQLSRNAITRRSSTSLEAFVGAVTKRPTNASRSSVPQPWEVTWRVRTRKSEIRVREESGWMLLWNVHPGATSYSLPA